MRDFLPVNSNLIDSSVSDNYIEIILSLNQQEFIDYNAFIVETKTKIVTPDGKSVSDNSKFTVIDGLGDRILPIYTLLLNWVPCESNSHFGLHNDIKSYTSMSKDSLSRQNKQTLIIL